MEVLFGVAVALTPLRTPPVRMMALPSFVPTERVAEIAEEDARAAFENMQTVDLDLPSAVATGPLPTTYLKTNVAASNLPPVLLVHGFDISSLEYRRLLPRLEELGIEAVRSSSRPVQPLCSSCPLISRNRISLFRSMLLA